MRNRFFLILGLFIIYQRVFPQSSPNIEYLFPIPGTGGHPKETVIIIRYKKLSPAKIANLKTFIQVKGGKSGPVQGKTVISSDERTIIYKPFSDFQPGERVSVHLNPISKGEMDIETDTTYQFIIMFRENVPQNMKELRRSHIPDLAEPHFLKKQNTEDPVILNGISIPTDFPRVNITVNDHPDTGYIFLNTSWNSYPHYSLILDNSGNPIWYIRTQDNRQDLKVQPDGRLTMLTNLLDSPGFEFPGFEYVAMDTTYTVVDTFHVPSGYYGEEHDLQVLKNGHYLLIAKNDSIVDISQLISGGNPHATVTGNSVVEMDADDNPVFIWRSWDEGHYNILDAVHEDLYGSQIDYVHMNAIDVDLDGNILVSSRHMSEVTKINRQTGEVIWRLGGKHDYFTWENDDGHISYQHDIRVLPNGNYTIFDNGNYRYPYYSRAMEFSVDTTDWTVTKIWEYPEAHDIFAGWMGNTQRLSNGNTAICWADDALPKLTEVRPDGSKAFEMNFVESHASYRAFRFPWKAKAAAPYLVAEPWPDRVTLIFNKFGDPDVTEYRIYGGTKPKPKQIIATASQPFAHLSSELQNGTEYFFRVTAMNTQGQESGFSNEEQIYVNLIEPGQEMVHNGDFKSGLDYWNWQVVNDGQASYTVDDEELHIHIQQGGTEIWYLQLNQQNIPLVQGKTYVFEFDAYADDGRIIQFEVKKDSDPWTNYSKKGYTWLTTQKTHYRHEFIMEEPSDLHARIELNAGTSSYDVYVDNVSLKEAVTDAVDNEQMISNHYTLMKNYPNPFNSETTIRYKVPIESHITLRITNILGQEIKVWQFNKGPGIHTFRLDGNHMSSGIYFIRLQARSQNKTRQFQATRKLLLIK